MTVKKVDVNWHEDQTSGYKVQTTTPHFCIFDKNFVQSYSFQTCKAYLNDAHAILINKADSSGMLGYQSYRGELDFSRIRVGVAHNNWSKILNAFTLLRDIEGEFDLKPTEILEVSNTNKSNLYANSYVAIFDGDPNFLLSTVNISIYSLIIRIGITAEDEDIKRGWRYVFQQCAEGKGKFQYSNDQVYVEKPLKSGLLEGLFISKLKGSFFDTIKENYPKIGAYSNYHHYGVALYSGSDKMYHGPNEKVKEKWDIFAKKFGLRK